MNNRVAIVQLAEHFEKQSDIAMAIGVSRQYVHQIFKENDLNSPSFRPISICPVCGKKFTPQWNYFSHKWFEYCSKECGYRWRRTELICEVCGQPFLRRKRALSVKSPGRFCSNECQGKWLGKNHGFKGRNKMKSVKARNGKSVWLGQKVYDGLKALAEVRSAKMNEVANEAIEKYLVDEAWKSAGRK